MTDKTMSFKTENCKDGKKPKQRLTIGILKYRLILKLQLTGDVVFPLPTVVVEHSCYHVFVCQLFEYFLETSIFESA